MKARRGVVSKLHLVNRPPLPQCWIEEVGGAGVTCGILGGVAFLTHRPAQRRNLLPVAEEQR